MPQEKCTTKYCRNERAKHRTVCWKCRAKKWKAKNPEAYHFNALRNNARRRGKEFDLTLEQFKEFCEKTNYMERKGKSGAALTIDRIVSTKGYTAGNLRVLSHYDNTSHKYDNLPF